MRFTRDRVCRTGPAVHHRTIRAGISLRTHRGIVDIHYTDMVISFEHVSSTNLNETETTIHSNYIGWLNNMRQDIEDEMNLMTTLQEEDGGF